MVRNALLFGSRSWCKRARALEGWGESKSRSGLRMTPPGPPHSLLGTFRHAHSAASDLLLITVSTHLRRSDYTTPLAPIARHCAMHSGAGIGIIDALLFRRTARKSPRGPVGCVSCRLRHIMTSCHWPREGHLRGLPLPPNREAHQRLNVRLLDARDPQVSGTCFQSCLTP